MVFRKDALGPQGGRDRNRPALGRGFQHGGRRIVLDTGTGEDRDALCGCKQVQCVLGGLPAERRDAREEIGDRHILRRAIRHERIVHQRQMYRPARLRQHGGEAVAQPVIEIARAGDGRRQPGERLHDRRVVERRLACVLEFAKTFHVDRYLTAEDQHRRRVRLCRRHRGRHVAQPRPADAERGAETPAGARVAVGHVGGSAFMRGDDRLQSGMPRQRRQERIDQPAGHHEQMIEPLADKSVQNEVATGSHAKGPCCAIPIARAASSLSTLPGKPVV
jgi:hypothetical protein